MEQNLDQRMAQRLKALRTEHQYSLDQLSQICGLSRATLSRLENGNVSPTAAALGKLCAVYKISLSRLMVLVEANYLPLNQQAAQEIWVDPETGFTRKIISPPNEALAAEMLEVYIPQGQTIEYAAPPRAGLEHHLYMLDGALSLTVDGIGYQLQKGDCLRYQLLAESQFKTDQAQAAKYILTII